MPTLQMQSQQTEGMMGLAYVIAGAVIGALFGHFSGFLLGLVLGWLVADRLLFDERLKRLEAELATLRGRVGGESVRPEPAPPLRPRAVVPPPAPVQAAEREGPEGAPPVVPEENLEPPGDFAWQDAASPPRAAATTPPARPVPGPVTAFFTGGNLLVKTGIVILFFGVSFLVKYAAQHGLFPIELRLAASALGGLLLLAVGWRLRGKRLEYALALQGGGIGVLYITVFAAFRLYSLISPVTAFVLLVAISMLCGALAVLEETPTLALFGISGGFLAPLLASTGHGSHVFLFGYYAVLNAGIIGIAWFKSWRPLNLAGFLFTFVIGAVWGARYYRPEFFPTTEPFLVLFFFMYVGVAVLFALRQPPQLKGYLDGTLIFGTPVVSFALQATLVADYRYGLAWSALCAGIIYLLLALLLFRRDLALRPLGEAFAAFGTIYLTLAVPLAFDGRWTAAIWAVEGAAIAWTGVRQARKAPRLFGVLLQFAAGVAFASEGWEAEGALPILNAVYLGCLLLAVSGFWSGYTVYRHSETVPEGEKPLNCVLLGWALLWWLVGGAGEMDRHLPEDLLYGGGILLVTLTCAGCHFLERRLRWRPLVWPTLGIVPALWLLVLFGVGSHPLADGGWLSWPVALGILYVILYLHDREPIRGVRLLHGGALWLIAVLGTWELSWQVSHRLIHTGSWVAVAYVICPAVFTFFLGRWGTLLRWPVQRREEEYLGFAAVPLALWCLAWIFVANVVSSGDPYPFPWLPFANVFDLGVMLALGGVVVWYLRLKEMVGVVGETDPHPVPPLEREGTLLGRPPLQGAASVWPRVLFGGPGGAPALFAAAVFVWLNAMLARALHYWGGIPLNLEELFDSSLAQSSYAIFWTVLSLCVMVFASRRRMRKFWFSGGVLLAVVVLKLFVIDLAGQGTVERIVSFVAVGVLLLVIGWFSPVPPP